MRNFRDRLKLLEKHDWMNVYFFLFLTLVSVFFVHSYPERILIPVSNLLILYFTVILVSGYESRYTDDERAPHFYRFIRYWYPVFTILFCFKEVYVIMVSRSDLLYDQTLLQLDRMIFGTDPTVFLYSFNHPLLVEFFQIIYGIFYLMPAVFAAELYFWHRYPEMKYAIFVIMFGFYLSFIGYLLVPAVGPRFTIHDFSTTDSELPGIFFAQHIRDLINFGESIPGDKMNAMLLAQRDAFPSGHTIIIILIAYLSRKFRSHSFYFYLPYSILMIFSTVYLRYHYVIDLIAAVPFILVTVWFSNFIYRKGIKDA